MWTAILNDLKAIVAALEAQAGTALSFLLSFFKEAITEEEAALFPAFQALATKILNDEAAIQGLNVQQRINVVVADFLATLPADIVIAKTALVNSWAWAIAHQQGLTNGNQGVSATADFSGTTDSTPSASTTPA
jgi:hypothetical protein